MAHLGGRMHRRMKSAAVHPKLSGLSRCRHYRTFFDGHRQGINLAINEEVWGHAQGQKVVCHGVFNKLVVALLHGIVAVAVGGNQCPTLGGVLEMLLA